MNQKKYQKPEISPETKALYEARESLYIEKAKFLKEWAAKKSALNLQIQRSMQKGIKKRIKAVKF